jgi:hypothetical protein
MSNGPLKWKSKILVVTVSATCGLLAGYGFMSVTATTSGESQLASLAKAPKWQPLELGKHLAPVRVQILPPTVLPDRNDQEVEITGYVTLSQEAQGDVHYQWILPEGTSLVSGMASDSWFNVKPGQTAITKISVTGFSKEDRRVLSLEAFTQIGNNRLGNSAVVSSRPEDSMEYIAPAKMKSRQAFDMNNKLDN